MYGEGRKDPPELTAATCTIKSVKCEILRRLSSDGGRKRRGDHGTPIYTRGCIRHKRGNLGMKTMHCGHLEDRADAGWGLMVSRPDKLQMSTLNIPAVSSPVSPQDPGHGEARNARSIRSDRRSHRPSQQVHAG